MWGQKGGDAKGELASRETCAGKRRSASAARSVKKESSGGSQQAWGDAMTWLAKDTA